MQSIILTVRSLDRLELCYGASIFLGVQRGKKKAAGLGK